ncbi:hypothetical protein [Jejuia pallidilutea]|uniref:Uncharacterized protein n=1 Tax=Jejuia pallidilutea TaxID=504487 RepID=A0A090WZG0_9FLAO|nr:hypothetical protein [Jejuia pallidilutea]GAL67781.1 hypothetical protein JCM19301_1068 [Jejuia pallidilutea]GAL72762.1 hypothetical protein JCM19302_3256 [Jejuia pallidilutea]GAL88275.1 hypothetical protein JCM19538_1601 [Jejuia pallidilutea]
MTTIKSKKFTASFVIGLQKGYTKNLLTKQDVIKALQQEQEQLIHTKNVYLSAAISNCDIVLSGQVEPSVKLEFINYPKFPLSEKDFKENVLLLAKKILKALEQNRSVVVFHDEIVMLEGTEIIDPRITKTNL